MRKRCSCCSRKDIRATASPASSSFRITRCAHVKSIYHKLRIHSKQELVNIVDARRAAH
ncbi:MAG: hypothetical protein E6Y86_06990 [Slackia sp.]|uniref:hypothetical protein n=1 Tax=uncultured Slackia sp. TaxID=665903 RepID=UPI0029073F89|nr:hypothetical protein [Slackia sp.]